MQEKIGLCLLHDCGVHIELIDQALEEQKERIKDEQTVDVPG